MSANCETKQYYSVNYKEYIRATRDVNMTVHYDRFLSYLHPQAKILDVGFGSGRDMLYFKSKGYIVFGIDYVVEFVNNAKQNGLNAEVCDFHSIPYKEMFDGIWACASLVHSEDILLAFKSLYGALKKGGYIFLSIKNGSGNKIENGRFYQFLNEAKLKELCDKTGLLIVDIYNSDDLLKRKNSWINAILCKK